MRAHRPQTDRVRPSVEEASRSLPQPLLRNIASTIAASCTPKLRSNSSQTLAAAVAIRKPAKMALSVMGNFVQRLRTRPGVVLVGARKNGAENLTLPSGLLLFAANQCRVST